MKRFSLFVSLIFISFPCYAVWNVAGGGCNVASLNTQCDSLESQGRIVRVINAYPDQCSGAGYHQCQTWAPVGTSPCVAPQVWNSEIQDCSYPEGYCEDKSGEEAGIVENSPTPPSYDLLCNGGCAVEAAEYFQRTDNDNWVIAYRFTGQLCGPGDPLSEPDLPPGEEGPPAINPNQPPDTDDDGTPDSNDGDTDGDGIPNGTDTDDDGDGTPDADDPSPNGQGDQEEPSAANVALNCEQSPACTGDAIQCAQLVELWRLRCAGGGESEQVDESLAGQIVDSVNQAGEQALDSVQSEVEASLEDGSGVEMPDAFSSLFKGLFPTPSCADLSFNFKGSAFMISCTASADLRQFMAYLMYFTTAIYLYHLARKPVGE